LDNGHGEYCLYTNQAQPVLKSLIDLSEDIGFNLRGLAIESATLEDVFISLTGRKLRT
jgi:hypothetical protein